MPRIPFAELVEFATRFLTAREVPADNAAYLAETVVTSHAFGGSPSHGLGALGFFDRAIGDRIDPWAEPVLVRDKGAAVLIDGHRTFGQLAMRLAVETCCRKVGEMGVVMAAIRRTAWVAGLGVYLLPIAEAGYLGQAWSQASSCKDCAPFGGLDGKFSTNPVAYAFPTGGAPMVADFSTASFSMGQVGRMRRAGRKAPEKLFLEADGTVTDDPDAMDRGGTMFHLGGAHYGYKGYAMSLWCEAMAAMAGGSSNNQDLPQQQNVNLTVIDPENFAGEAYFLQEMRRFVPHCKDSRLREGFDRIRLPGERGYEALAEARETGVAVGDDHVRMLRELSEKHGLSPLA